MSRTMPMLAVVLLSTLAVGQELPVAPPGAKIVWDGSPDLLALHTLLQDAMASNGWSSTDNNPEVVYVLGDESNIPAGLPDEDTIVWHVLEQVGPDSYNMQVLSMQPTRLALAASVGGPFVPSPNSDAETPLLLAVPGIEATAAIVTAAEIEESKEAPGSIEDLMFMAWVQEEYGHLIQGDTSDTSDDPQVYFGWFGGLVGKMKCAMKCTLDFIASVDKVKVTIEIGTNTTYKYEFTTSGENVSNHLK